MWRYFIYTDVAFEWDGRKALRNADKHGLTFDDARTVFFDDQALDGESPQPTGEPRHLRLGRTTGGHIAVVVYTLRCHDDETAAIRIISARCASRREREAYHAQD